MASNSNPDMTRTLPAELLLAIFADGADSDPAKLMPFVLVCRHWRDLIIGEPTLWSNLNSQVSITGPQWRLQLARSAGASLRVRIEKTIVRPYQPEPFTSIILQTEYIPRITELTVLIRNEVLNNGFQFSPWKALMDGRDWPTLRSLRVEEGRCADEDIAPLFQLNIRAPFLEKIWLYRVSVSSWRGLGLGAQTQVVDWAHEVQPSAATVADFYSILSQLANLTALCIRSAWDKVTLGALIHTAPALYKLTVIELNLLDATIQDIEAVLRLSPQLVHLSLCILNDIKGSRVTSRLSDQRGSWRNKLESLAIYHNTDRRYAAPSFNSMVVDLIEDSLDISSLRSLSLSQFVIPRGSSLLSRCKALVTLDLTVAILDPTFIVDLQQCHNLETMSIEVRWDSVDGGVWPALDHLAPLPRLESAHLSTYGADDATSEAPAAIYGSCAVARLARNASTEVYLEACLFISAAEIRLLFPQTTLHNARLSITDGLSGRHGSLLDVRLAGWLANTGVDTSTSRPHLQHNETTRNFVIDPNSLTTLFEAVQLWLEYPSQLEAVSLHAGIADRFKSVVQDAMGLLRESKFESCSKASWCSHICRGGEIMTRADESM